MKAVNRAFALGLPVGDLTWGESDHVTQYHDFALFFGKRRECRADGLGIVELDPELESGSSTVSVGVRRFARK